MTTQSKEKEVTVERTVLTQAQYQSLEKQLQAPTVSVNTTEIMAGYQLGIQSVLKMLREGWVVK
jgi:hypothetical protein